ncbi:MAG: glycosyltransferase family 4 protein [Oligoflexus sp.]
MKQSPLKVLHIDTELTWRGGENQVRLLMEGGKEEAEWFLAAPRESAIAQRLSALASLFPLERPTLQWLPAMPRLARFCREQGINIVDCQSSKAHSIGLILKRLVPSLKLVVHRRVDFLPAKGMWSRRKYLHPSVDAYIAISQAIAEILVRAGIPKQKIHVVRSAVDPKVFTQVNRRKIRPSVCTELGFVDHSRPIIINVAYHTPQKGQETLIYALSHLKKMGHKFYAIFAGEGPLTKHLMELSQKLGCESELRFLGIRKDVPRLLAASDICAMPSRYEGLGTSILDAIHAGCAVAATRVGGIPEMIQHGHTGLLSEVEDDHGLAANLAILIDQDEKRQFFSETAKKHISQLFSLDSMVEGNLAVYRQLTSQ